MNNVNGMKSQNKFLVVYCRDLKKQIQRPFKYGKLAASHKNKNYKCLFESNAMKKYKSHQFGE